MTPYLHARSSAQKHSGEPEDYIKLHEWFDELKSHTGDWTHRALRHHSLGVQQACDEFGPTILNSKGHKVPTKLLAEQHVMEDCGFIPTVSDWLRVLRNHPEPWMLRVKTKGKSIKFEDLPTTE